MPKILNYYLYRKTSYIKKDYPNTYKVAYFKEDYIDKIGELDLNNIEYNSYLLSKEESNNNDLGKV
jgi:hypothetical protein